MTNPPAYEEIRRRALELVEEGKIDPGGSHGKVRELVSGAVEEYQRRAHLGQGRALHDPHQMVDRVLRSVAEFGPLTELLNRSDVDEIFIEGPRVTYLEKSGRLRGLGQPTSEAENRHVVDRLLAEAQIVGVPGSGFGPSGEGYFRVTAFGSHADSVEAVERIATRLRG